MNSKLAYGHRRLSLDQSAPRAAEKFPKLGLNGGAVRGNNLGSRVKEASTPPAQPVAPPSLVLDICPSPSPCACPLLKARNVRLAE